MNKKILSLFLAIVMVLGAVSPAFAAGFTPLNNPEKASESELIEENGKLKAKLSLPKTEKRKTRSIARAKAGAEPKFGETKVIVNISKHGIGDKEFAFDKVFGTGAVKKITLYNDADGTSQEKTFTKDDTSITFDTPVPMDDVVNEEVYIEFEGKNVAGKLTWEESAPEYGGGSNITTFKLDLYQVRNTDVVVTTKTADGTEVQNPTTGKIKLGSMNIVKDIPEDITPLTFVDRIHVENVDQLNGDPNYSVEGLENGVIVDKANNKVYKPGEFVLDDEGIKPAEVTLTEKPIVTETEPKIDDPDNPGTKITDPDYVAVTFAKGDHGEITENKTYYVFKGVEMNSTLTPPTVIPNNGWTQKTGAETWNPELATKYIEATEHVAQYKYTGDDVVPQNPGEEKPDVPKNFVLVEFKQGDHGTLKGTTKYWVNPEKTVTVTDPTVNSFKGFTFTGWDKALTQKFTTDTKITAEYTKKEEFSCLTKDALKNQFENAADGLFSKINSKEGVYIGSYDKATKTVEVAIIDKTKGIGEISGTGLISNLWDLKDNNYLYSFKIGNQDERVITPTMTMNDVKTLVILDMGNALNKQSLKGLEDFIGESITLQVKVKQPGCNNAVTIDYTIKGKEAISSILKDKLDPKDIIVWKDAPVDEINWKDGVKLNDANKDNEEYKAYLKDAIVEEASEPARKTDAVGKIPGKVKVTFSDGSSLIVDKQNLIVKENILSNNDDAPKDAIEVKFYLGEGVKVVKEGVTTEGNKDNPVLYRTYKIKPGTDLSSYKHSQLKATIFELINAEVTDGYTEPVTWKGNITSNPKNYVVSKDNNEFTASAKKTPAVCKPSDVLKEEFEKAANEKFNEIKSKDGVYSAVYDADKHKVTVTILDKTKKFTELRGTGLVAGLFELKEKNNVVAIQIGAQDRINLRDDLTMSELAQLISFGIGNELNAQGVASLNTLEDFAGKTVAVKLYVKEAGCDNEVSVIYYITGQLNDSDKDIIPYEPANPQNPTDENDPNIPKKDKDGKDIVPSDFVRVAFKVDPNPSGTLTFDDVVEKSVISALVRITKPQKKWADFTMPTTNDTDTYKFLKWEMPTNKVVADGDVAVAKFIKNGDKIDPKDTVPEGVHKVTLKQGMGVEDNEKYATYAIFDGKTLEEAGIVFDPVAQQGFEKAGWFDGENRVANLGEVVIDGDKTFEARANALNCMTEEGLKEQFEKAANPMFDKVGSKEGIYIGHFDEAKKEVTVYIIDKTQGAKEISGTGLISGLTELYKNNYLTKIQVGNQEERDLKQLAVAAPAAGMTVEQMFKFAIGADLLNAVQSEGNKTGTLADFIDKTVVLKLTIEQPGCNKPVTVEYTVNGKEAASSLLKDKLDPQDISVWLNDEINWNDGVKLKDGTEDADGKLQGLLDKATVTDESGRNSDTVGKYPGTLKVVFEDGSELTVENQNLYVREEKEEITDNNKDWPIPKDGLEVQFKAGEGVKKDAEGKDLIKTVLLKVGTVLEAKDFPVVELETGYTKPAKWTGNGNNEGFVVSKTNNVFTANAEKTGDIIVDDTPDTDDDKPEGYVTVKFLPGDNGSLEGATKFYVNPNAKKKNSDLTEPTIKANVGYKVADPKWDPEFITDTEIKADATYTAKYTKLDDIIKGHDENGDEVEKPEGYVTVRFLVDKNGTLDGETVYYVNPEAKKTIKHITPPTIKVKDEYVAKGYKVGDPMWEPDLTNDETPITADRYYVANFDCDHPVPTEFEISYISGNPEGGSVTPASETVAIDVGEIKGSTATAKEGYKFVKWIDAKGKEVSKDEKFVPDKRESATYIAVFEKEETVTPEPTEFTIKYRSVDKNMGTVSKESETVAIKGGVIEGSTATEKSGYKFVKWIDTDGNEISRDKKILPTKRESATYIAVFEKVQKPNPTDPTKPTEPTTPSEPTKPEGDRINGKDRIETAIEISKKYFGQASTVIVVDRKDFPDAMTSSVLSKLLKAPILLTETNKLDPRVAAEIERLGARDVIIVGGNSSVSEAVKKELAKFDKDTVERIYGKDRYETSAQVARRVVGITGKLGHAVVASGQVFADALTVAPYASREGYPILLVKANNLPKTVKDVMTELAINKVTIAGGYTTVEKSLETSLPTVVERLRGKSRYETAIDIANKKFSSAKEIFLANGEEWMDALVIGPVGGILDMPILLTEANSAPKSLRDYIAKAKIEKITAIGGRSMVSDKVLSELSK